MAAFIVDIFSVSINCNKLFYYSAFKIEYDAGYNLSDYKIVKTYIYHYKYGKNSSPRDQDQSGGRGSYQKATTYETVKMLSVSDTSRHPIQ